MAAFVARRLMLLPLVGLGVTLLVFALIMRLSPEMRASLYITDPRQLAAIGDIIRTYELDAPFHTQYVRWVGNLLRGDMGWSETAKMPVAAAIRAFFPATVELAVASFIPALTLGIWLGTRAAVNRDRPLDHLSRFLAISLRCLPSFVWGLLLLMAVYGSTGLFPPGRLSLEAQAAVNGHGFRQFTGLHTIDGLLNGRLWITLDALQHLVLPATALVMVEVALLTRITRSSMLETLRQDYVRTARSKGLPETEVINLHARRNALIPVITIASLQFVGFLGGLVITETVFNFPGVGRWGAAAALQLDVPGVAGFALFFAAVLVIGNLAADVLYAYFDPRIRLD